MRSAVEGGGWSGDRDGRDVIGSLRLPLRHQRALARCSAALFGAPVVEGDRRAALEAALEQVRTGACVQRAALYESFDDGTGGHGRRCLADAAAPGVPRLTVAVDPRMTPWLCDGEAGPEGAASPAVIVEGSWVIPGMLERLAAGKVVAVDSATIESVRALGILVPADLSAAALCPVGGSEGWWGFVGLADVAPGRPWHRSELRFLRTASAMLGLAIQRWRSEATLRRQLRYERALADAARVLLRDVEGKEAWPGAVEVALAPLRAAARAARAFVFANEIDDDGRRCSALFAHVSDSRLPAVLGRRWPEASCVRAALERDEPWIGYSEEYVPAELQGSGRFGAQRRVSMVIPVTMGGVWWGGIGLTDLAGGRQWSDDEMTMLRAAADLLSGTLSRWRAQAALQSANAELARRVTFSTAELRRVRSDEGTMAGMAARVGAAMNYQTALMESLTELGRMIRASRVILVRGAWPPELKLSRIDQWQEPPLQPMSESDVRDRMLGTPWMAAGMRLRRTVVIRDTAELPLSAAADRAVLERAGVRWATARPLFAEDQMLGAVMCLRYRDGADAPLEDNALRVLDITQALLAGLLQHGVVRAELEARVADRTRELSAFMGLAMLSGGALDAEQVLDDGLARIADVGGCDTAALHLLGETEHLLELAAVRGLDTVGSVRIGTVVMDGPVHAWLFGNGSAVLRSDTDGAPLVPNALLLPGFSSTLVVRLAVGGRVIGIVTCYRREGRPGGAQVSLMTALAEQVALVLENLRLRQQAEDAAVAAERQRLARELHDAVTQSVYSQTLLARSARLALEDGDANKVRDSLMQLERSSVQALREMRLLLYQLRPRTLARHGLARAVEERFDTVERRLGIQAAFRSTVAEPLAAEVEDTLYHVAMEALTNVLKHAGARSVEVGLEETADGIALRVVDDGCGYDPRQPATGMGMANMRHRAAQHCGELRVDSRSGAGTTVWLLIPRCCAIDGGCADGTTGMARPAGAAPAPGRPGARRGARRGGEPRTAADGTGGTGIGADDWQSMGGAS